MNLQIDKSKTDASSLSHNYSFPFESNRLRIRHLKDDDFSILHAYRNDEEVAKYQSWTDKSAAEIKALIAEKTTLGTIGEWFTFAIASKINDELLGECAFCINSTLPTQAEMGITLSRGAQGNNYANEAITAIINFIFQVTQVEEIILITYLENQACINMLGKLNHSHRMNHVDANNNDRYAQYGVRENETLFYVLKTEWRQL